MLRRWTRGGDAHAELERTAVLPRALAPGHDGYIPGLSGIWLRRPLVYVALSLLAGDLAGLSGHIPMRAWALGAALTGALAIGLALAKRPRVWLLLMCVVMLGGLAGASAMEVPDVPPEGECYLTGRIVGVDGAKGERIVLDIDRVSANGARYKGKLRLTLYRDEAEEGGAQTASLNLPKGCAIGAQVALFADVYLPQGQRGEGGFDYRAYLIRRGVYSCASGDLAGAQFEPTGTLRAANWCWQARMWVLGRLDEALGEQAVLAGGVMLGDGGELPDELSESFRRAGFSHILAVSGMHITFLISVLSSALRLTPVRLRAIITGTAIVLYCALTGFTPSVARAGIMGMVALCTSSMGLRYDGMSALALAAIIIVVLWPGAALDAGFALSFTAVLAIYAYYPTLSRALERRREGDGARPGMAVRAARAVLRYVREGMALTFSAMLGLMPLTSAYFGQVNLAGIATSPAGVGASMLLMCAGWLSALMHGWSGPLGEAVSALARACAIATERVAEWTAGMDWGVVHMRAMSSWWLCALVPVMLWSSRFRPLARAWRVACMCLALALTAVALMPPRAGEGIDYVLVDVGQGDGQLFTDGATAVVIDTGGQGSALVDLVRRRGLRVEALIVTHLHDDHAGALEELADMARVERIYLPERAQEAADAKSLEQLDRLSARGVEAVYLSAGDVLEPLPGLALTVLHPGKGARFEDANDYSLVIMCEYAGRSVLITGDLTGQGEDFRPGECDVLKVAHHGSADSSTLEFLTAANPKLALISASANNSYGLPSGDALARLEHIGAQVMSTAQSGDITVHISPAGEMTARGYIDERAG